MASAQRFALLRKGMREGENEGMSARLRRGVVPSPFHKGEGQGGGLPSFPHSLILSFSGLKE